MIIHAEIALRPEMLVVSYTVTVLNVEPTLQYSAVDANGASIWIDMTGLIDVRSLVVLPLKGLHILEVC
jgi:hypothetical protein